MKTEHLEDNFDIMGELFDEIQPLSCRFCKKVFNYSKEFNEHVQNSQKCIEQILQKNVSRTYKNVWGWKK